MGIAWRLAVALNTQDAAGALVPADGTGRPTVVTGADLAVLTAVGHQVHADGPMIAIGPVGAEDPGRSGGPAAVEGFAAAVPADGGWDAAAAQVVSGWGAPRVLITCPSPVPRGRLADSGPGDWQAALDPNLGTAAAACRAFVPVMRGHGPAAIIMLAWRPSGEPGQVHLAAASGAIQLLALALAADLGGDGITVNAVTVGEHNLPAVGPVLELLLLADAGYVTAEVLRAGTE
jgi:NAD(P)-dependent dehydrogenase (short-subunit alcohol dehydrogenase family)